MINSDSKKYVVDHYLLVMADMNHITVFFYRYIGN